MEDHRDDSKGTKERYVYCVLSFRSSEVLKFAASRMRGRIDSDLNALDELHSRVGWTPQSTCVRPSNEQREEKQRLLDNASARYLNSTRDYILARIFHLPTRAATRSFTDQRLTVDEKTLAAARQEALQRKDTDGGWKMEFVPNLFPYQVPDGTKHYVMWFLLDPDNPAHIPDEAIITKVVNSYLKDIVKTDNYEFVWYRNPKPTIEDGGLTHHVQVFWREVEPS